MRHGLLALRQPRRRYLLDVAHRKVLERREKPRGTVYLTLPVTSSTTHILKFEPAYVELKRHFMTWRSIPARPAACQVIDKRFEHLYLELHGIL